MSDEPQTQHVPHYPMHIAWSEKDGAYLVTLPEWMPRLINSIAVTHGATHEQAAKNGQEVLDMLIEQAQAAGEPLASHCLSHSSPSIPMMMRRLPAPNALPTNTRQGRDTQPLLTQ